jgi:hypothetical protein
MTLVHIKAKRILILFTLAIVSAGVYVSFHNRSSAAGFSGAIYTTTFNGLAVNENSYSNNEDVYLNGGPQNATSNGLPDGTYYFQVTDPSGATLLSADPAVCRQLLVSSGRVVAADGPACQHPTGILNSSNGSTPVKLAPFNDTPNNGAEYKVWLIRQGSTTTIADDGMHLNFNRNNAKTDNFKVVFQPCTNCNPNAVLSGMKFYDANGNALFDEGEVPVAGVQIAITLTTDEGTETVIVTTDASGNWSIVVPTGTVYKIGEYLPGIGPDVPGAYWIQTAPVVDSVGFQGYGGTANGDHTNLNFGDICFHPDTEGNPVASATPCSVSYVPTPTPTPTPCPDCQTTAMLSGKKFYDANQNGLFDETEVPVEGVHIAVAVTVNEMTTISIVSTDASGNWSLVVPIGAEYKIGEFLPDACPADGAGSFWLQTAPVADDEGFQGYGGTANEDHSGLVFGDVCFRPDAQDNPAASATPCGVCYPPTLVIPQFLLN